MRHVRGWRHPGEDLRLVHEPFPRRIGVTAKDANNDLIDGVVFAWFIDNQPAGEQISNGNGALEVLSPVAVVSVKATYNGESQGPVKLALDQKTYEFRFDLQIHPRGKEFSMKHFPALIGIFFILLAVGLAFAFNNPSSFQRQVVLAMLSLGAGGFGGEIAGFIKADLTLGNKLAVSAGGAAAIFVLFYFFLPAGTII